MITALWLLIGVGSLAVKQAQAQEISFAGLHWGASAADVRNTLTDEGFRQVPRDSTGGVVLQLSEDSTGYQLWTGEIEGLRVWVWPRFVHNQLRLVFVRVFPSGKLSAKATVDSVRRVLARHYGEPRLTPDGVRPGALSWGSGHLCFEVLAEYAELQYSNESDFSDCPPSPHF